MINPANRNTRKNPSASKGSEVSGYSVRIIDGVGIRFSVPNGFGESVAVRYEFKGGICVLVGIPVPVEPGTGEGVAVWDGCGVGDGIPVVDEPGTGDGVAVWSGSGEGVKIVSE